MRLSDADREQLYDLLAQHAAAGRITLDELEHRIARVGAASSRSEATALLSDLPPLAPAASPPRWRGRAAHGEADRPELEWQATGERFRDPRTQRIMRVWVDSDGSRHYVPDQPD